MTKDTQGMIGSASQAARMVCEQVNFITKKFEQSPWDKQLLRELLRLMGVYGHALIGVHEAYLATVNEEAKRLLDEWEG